MHRQILRLHSAALPEGELDLLWTHLPVSIGRSHRADITISDALLSRIHCEIRPSPEGHFLLVDNESTNLTIVNERDIDQHPLQPGDRILLGETELLVTMHSPEDSGGDRTTREIPRMSPRADRTDG